jgi:hypothetical protein
MRRLMLTAIALLTGASSSLAQGHMGTPFSLMTENSQDRWCVSLAAR